MDNDRGYRQAIENVAWHIHKLASEAAARGENGIAMLIKVKADPAAAKPWNDLDAIMAKICEIYMVSHETVVEDVSAVLKEYIITDKR